MPGLNKFFKENFNKSLNNCKLNFSHEFPMGATIDLFELNIYYGLGYWSKEPFILIHIGNLRDLFNFGRNFDLTNNTFFLDKIKERFRLKTNCGANFIWNYIKYVENFYKINYPIKNYMIGILAQKIFKEKFNLLSNFLLSNITNNYIFEQIKNSSNITNCIDLFLKLGDLNKKKAEYICINNLFNNFSANSMGNLLDLCFYKSNIEKDYFLKTIKLSTKDFEKICNNKNHQKINLAEINLNLKKTIKIFYNCSQNIYCTNEEIAIKQLNNSFITRNPLKNISHLIKPSDSVFTSFLNQNLFEKPIELFPIINKISQRNTSGFINETKEFIEEKYLNSSWISDLFIKENTMDLSLKDKDFLNYLRYLIIEFEFGGLILEKTVREVVEGYDDIYLNKIKNKLTYIGGNPFQDTIVKLIDKEYNREIIVNTGKNQNNLLNNIIEINGSRNIQKLSNRFNGNFSEKYYSNVNFIIKL